MTYALLFTVYFLLGSPTQDFTGVVAEFPTEELCNSYAVKLHYRINLVDPNVLGTEHKCLKIVPEVTEEPNTRSINPFIMG